jgi:hypothetical protein
MDSTRLLDRRAIGPRSHPHRLPSALPVSWLGLGLVVWGAGMFEPGNLLVDTTIVAVLAGVLLLTIAAPRLAATVLVALAVSTPTLTMIAAGITDQLRDTPANPSPLVRVLTVVVVVSAPSLVGAVLIARTHPDR